MRQYLEAKRQYPLALVLIRMGDFYELFYEDALVAARALDLTLTSRSKDATGAAVPMCGVPHHAADGYITRLVKRGHRVAICEQVEDPRKAKGVVRREVVRVISPGTLADASYLDAREPAFLLAISGLDKAPGPSGRIGVALLDLSTGEFQVAEYHGAHARQALADDVAVLAPREIVVASDVDLQAVLPSAVDARVPVTGVDPWTFDVTRAEEVLRDLQSGCGHA
jgi:DNA mismatch repair protein MutS